jgi:hypothetical protein
MAGEDIAEATGTRESYRKFFLEILPEAVETLERTVTAQRKYSEQNAMYINASLFICV